MKKGQTTQWPKEKREKDKQRSIKRIHKTTSRVTNKNIYKRISTNKTDRHDLTELLLNLVFNTIKQTNKQYDK
jgi:poly-D-alanine transfer protein DltD